MNSYAQAALERDELILHGRVLLEFFCMGLARPWGSAQDEGLVHGSGGHVPGTQMNRDRTMKNFKETELELLMQSRLQDVLAIYGAQRIIWLDFTPFVSHADPHVGWNDDNIAKMMKEDGGKKIQAILRYWLSSLRAKPIHVLKEGVATVGFCASGRTRSAGGITILMNCCKAACFWLSHLEVVCLSQDLWPERKCKNGIRCNDCCRAPGHLPDAWFGEARDMFFHSQKIVYGL
jgi:hypothetical protein